MRISELSQSPTTTTTPLSDLESLIQHLESLSSSSSSSSSTLLSLSDRIRSLLPHLSSHSPLLLWKLSFRLWNASVDLSNSLLHLSLDCSSPLLHHIALLRTSACDLLLLSPSPPPAVPSPDLKSSSLLLKTSLLWLRLRRPDLALSCLDRCPSPASPSLLLDLSLARSSAAWDLGDRPLAFSVLRRSNSLLATPDAYRSLAEQYLRFARAVLADGEGPLPASTLLEEALQLCEKGLGSAREGGGQEEKVSVSVKELEKVRGRCLRFVAAERAAAGDHEGVLRCVKVMRGEGRGEGEHPSVGYLAARAWVGVGRTGEAGREVVGLVGREGVPEDVGVQAAEEYVEAGGGGERGVAVAVAERFGARAVVRVVGKMVVVGRGRGREVAEVVCEERLVGVFKGGEVAKERGTMHALIWNCGAEHFRAKEYEIAAELFEKSMLYLARDEENRSRRANCHRVLCLCYLGLSQLNRAEEFINEAEKLEPNINCAFLKLKIFLQKKAEKEGISQVEAMVNCIDFKPEYLTLSIHEAMACHSIAVAIASLSILLSLYSPGKTMPMPEVAVLRNIITLLLKTPDSELEILKHTKRAWSRMSEVGTKSFFGNGAVGEHELKWFAAQSWNLGLKTGKDKKYDQCVEFLELASEFYHAIPEKKTENNAMVCKAQILSVAAMIAGEDHSKLPLPDTKVNKAVEMLDRARKILSTASASTSSMDLDENQLLIEPDLVFLHTLNAYQLLGRLSEDPGSKQLQLIKSVMSSSKTITSQNLLHLGLIASQGPKPNPEVANFVLSACLSELLATPSPDYQTISLVIRKLAGLSTFKMEKSTENCDTIYDVYQRAYRIIAGLKKGEYPVEEGKWLATTAWNRSGMAVRLGQVENARMWMKMGMDLARYLPGMESYNAGMEACLNNFEKISAGHSQINENSER